MTDSTSETPDSSSSDSSSSDSSSSDSSGSDSLASAPSMMGVKLAVLAIVVLGMASFAYDILIAKPSVQKAYYAITDESMRLSNAEEDSTISSTDVHRILGKSPIETFEDGDRTVEVFGFMGGMLVNKHKLFVSYETVDGKLVFRAGRVLKYEIVEPTIVESDPNPDAEDAAGPTSEDAGAATDSGDTSSESDPVEEMSPVESP